ncbi:MAG TPA: tetratricopeptide repeat protein [Mycobacteriales bacterium]|nr:tetratricopeptide repeat protein [Mycobacteriales bacterium]
MSVTSESSRPAPVDALWDDLDLRFAAAGYPGYKLLETRTGIPKSTLNNWFTRRTVPQWERFAALLTYLGEDERSWRPRWQAAYAALYHRRAPAAADEAWPDDAQPGGAGPVDGPEVPRQLPSGPGVFTGRTAALAQLDSMVQRPDADRTGSVPVFVIVGPGGIGKTALAVHWSRQHRADFPDGQLYLDLQGFGPADAPVPPAVALRMLLDSIGVPADAVPADSEARAALLRSRLAGRRMLLVLDNARTSDQVVPLLPGDASCAAVVTSRSKLGTLAVQGARVVTLDLLSEQEARAMLGGHLGRARVDAEPAAVAMLLERCAGLPLALSIVAARAATNPAFPLAAVADELGDAATRLDALNAGELSADLRGVFSWSYRTLPVAAARVFRLLGTSVGVDIGLPAVSALSGLDAPATRSAMRTLVDAHLVQEHRPGRFQLHDLLRLFAAERLAEDTSRDEQVRALERLLEWYLRTADAADRILMPLRSHVLPAPADPSTRFTTYEDALAWCESEHPNIPSICGLAARLDLGSVAWKLPVAFFSYYKLHKDWAEYMKALTVALDAVRRLGDPEGEAWVLNSIGITAAQLDQHDLAVSSFKRALRIRRRTGDRNGQAQLLNNLGEAYRRIGRYELAIDCYEQDQLICREDGDTNGQSVSLNNLGKVQLAIGQPEAALDSQRRALTLREHLGDDQYLGEIHLDLGDALRVLGRRGDAIEHYRLAADILGELDDVPSAAEALINLTELLRNSGRAEEAALRADQVRSTIELLGDNVPPALAERTRLLLADRRRAPDPL